MSSTHSVCLPCRVRTNRVPRCRIHLSAESSHKQVLWGEAEDKEGVHCHHFQPLTTFIWKPVDEQMFYTLLFAYSCYYIGVLFLHVSKQMHINPQHTDLRRLICSYILWSYALHFHTDTHTQCLTQTHTYCNACDIHSSWFCNLCGVTITDHILAYRFAIFDHGFNSNLFK